MADCLLTLQYHGSLSLVSGEPPGPVSDGSFSISLLVEVVHGTFSIRSKILYRPFWPHAPNSSPFGVDLVSAISNDSFQRY